ncbi:MAG: PAS-domain containing protein [Planctomycetes bacterium]|nr:PAS-domain containing protein [Planctomycetota bacterium]
METTSPETNTKKISSYETAGLQSRLKWFLFIRLMIAILALIAIILYQQKTFKSFPPHLISAYTILIFACFINILYLIAIRWTWISLRKQAMFQITLDILIETLLIYFTGGIGGSIFIYLYFASIVSGALLISARSSFIFASLASIFLSGITIIYFLGVHYNRPLPFLPNEYIKDVSGNLSFALPYLFFFALALHLVAFLSGRLTIELSHERILNEEILQGMSTGLMVINLQGKIAFYNLQARKLLRLPKDIFTEGAEVKDIFDHPNYKQLHDALLDSQISSGEITIKDDKNDYFIEFGTTSLKDSQEKTRGTIVLFNDVTLARKTAEITKQAERWQSLSEMSTSIAHEIRNPLASIRSAAQELGILDKLSPDEKKLMDIIIKETKRLNQIITEFIDFARERPVCFQYCNIGQIVDEVAILLEHKETAKPVKIQKEIKGKIFCSADSEQLKQVLINLGLNALEADTDKVILKAYTEYNEFKNAEEIIIEVIDFGKGIEPSYRDKIYDPFFTTKPKGVGMGLAIAGKIIQLHKGRISFETAVGKGTKFTIRLPCPKK